MAGKRSIIFASAGAAIAAVIAAVVVAGGALSTDKPAAPLREEPVTAYLTGGSPVLGLAGAPLTMVEFGDYQCTNCYRYFTNTEPAVLENFVKTGKLKVVFVDFPFIGPDSVKAALAAHCAGDQNMYWEYHDELYSNWNGENTGWARVDNLKMLASNLGLERGAFDQCLDGGKHAKRVEDNFKLGSQLGVTGTPTFFIVDEADDEAIKIVGAQPYSVFEQMFNSRL